MDCDGTRYLGIVRVRGHVAPLEGEWNRVTLGAFFFLSLSHPRFPCSVPRKEPNLGHPAGWVGWTRSIRRAARAARTSNVTGGKKKHLTQNEPSKSLHTERP